MKADRGAYRALYCAILDDADATGLSDRAWRVLTLLKLSLPASGIGIPVLLQLAQRANCTPKQLDAALAELEAAKPGEAQGWIVRDRNIVWLVNGLKHEPNLNARDRKHRAFVLTTVAPLGTKPIVAAFRAYYADWFLPAEPAKEEGPSEGLGRAIEGPSEGHPRLNGGAEKGHRRVIEAQETRDKSLLSSSTSTPPRTKQASGTARAEASDADASAAPVVVPPAELPAWLYLHGEWEKFVGAVDKGRFRKAFRPLAEPEGGAPLPYPLTTLRTAIEWYAAKRRGTREWEFVGAERFVSGVTEHVRIARLDMQDRVKVLPLPAGAV